ncbi:MAG: rod shape-determining protein MreC [Candidatus Magasanikbacteria bacterium CG10_big_fil_rev_8_21_14_0_10_36_32]|uniref:Cell shape-determining protein MreC n=1 Tax=Candidatus Magasanikbacteria bacterium CG10_big_fil_rev_8_21_14_0_10_36_32 TaxID=1974646 RepID=A0A2M6W7P1_9BACT|nr:MAG: rod shape-determining protein MreC [Candidatus Magasanikbacteria bacterium CG10_big_fil_rev_8_21_14_0_10_36_32]
MFRNLEKKTYFYLGTIFVVLIFFNYLGWLNPIKSGIRAIFVPIFVKSAQFSVGLKDGYAFFKDKETFFDTYRECEADRQDKQLIEAQIKTLENENSELRQLLNFKDQSDILVLGAQVIGKNVEGAEKTIIIDKGSEAGTKIDQPVIVGNGILIGKIIKAEKDISIVRLINDSQLKIAATVLNHDHSLGVVEGGYGLSVKMNFIPRNEVVVIGDQIITSGLEMNIPRGLLIGNITAVENESYQPFQEAILTPSTDLSKPYIVSVLLTN